MHTVLQEYDLVSQIPKPGGMGLVYKARRKSGELIALKVIPLTGNPDGDAVARSERRGAAVQQMLAARDRHVPRVFACGEKHGVFFIEMEFIDGEDLSTMLARNGPLPPREAARVACEVASFLQVAQATTCGRFRLIPARLVHSDLKPSNIRIARNGDVKILDFGIARAGWQTQTMKQFGSVPYMSPERIDGRIDRHADYWALGVVLHEMLTGQPPSPGPVPALPATVPAALHLIVTTMLQRDLADRYHSAAEIKEDLASSLQGTRPAHAQAARRPCDGNTITVTRRVSIARTAIGRARQAGPGIAPRIAAAALVLLTVDGYFAGRAAGHLRADISAQKVDARTAWARYERIRWWTVVPMVTSGLRTSIRDKLVADADRVLVDFRRDQPAVRASNWKTARDLLRNALSLGADAPTRARLLCAEAHLLRIDGRFPEAIDLFQQAVRLDARSPDAYLGLARIYRTRADRQRQSAITARGQPDEKDDLAAAAADYERSLDSYAPAVAFASVHDTVRLLRGRLAPLR